MNEIVKKWGQKQRSLDLPRNDELKKEIFSRYSPSSSPAPRLRSRIPWLSLALAGVAVVVFFLSAKPITPVVYKDASAPTASGGYQVPAENSMAPDRGDSFLEKILPNPQYDAPITDTREFLKTNYYSTIRSRHVIEQAGRVQTIIRGFGGRVDSQSSSEKSGYISFAVPADKFELFRSEIKSLARGKFYIEQTYSENFLPQKQSIEEQQGQISSDLGRLYTEREVLQASHQKTVANLQYQVNTTAKELAALRAEVTDDPVRRAQIDARVSELVKQENNLRTRLANENRDYQNKISSLEAQIKNTEDDLARVQREDQNLVDNIATVNGTISLNWISIWELVDLYVPGSPLAWIILFAALGAFFWRHRRIEIPVS